MPEPMDAHFAAGRQYRQEELGEAILLRNWWRRATFVALGCLALSTLGLIYVATLPKHIPYPLRWDSATGDVQPVGLVTKMAEEPVTIRRWLTEFIHMLRGISPDLHLMKQRWTLHADWRLTPMGQRQLIEYEKTWKPLTQVEPLYIDKIEMLRQTDRTWQARWRETRLGKDGKELSSVMQRGIFTFQVRAPQSLKELEFNPAGIFFHTWSFDYER